MVSSADAAELMMFGFSAGVGLFLVVGLLIYGVLHALRFIESA